VELRESQSSVEASKDEDPLTTAEAEFEQARAELYAVLGPARSGQPGAAPAPASRPAKPSDAAGADAPKPKAEKKASENGCATACRAFESLGRAATAVCRLTAENDERCTRAKGIVGDAERRVASCGCKTQ